MENEAVKNAQINDCIALEAQSNDASAKRYMDQSQAYMKSQEHHMQFEKNAISSMEAKEKSQQEVTLSPEDRGHLTLLLKKGGRDEAKKILGKFALRHDNPFCCMKNYLDPWTLNTILRGHDEEPKLDKLMGVFKKFSNWIPKRKYRVSTICAVPLWELSN